MNKHFLLLAIVLLVVIFYNKFIDNRLEKFYEEKSKKESKEDKLTKINLDISPSYLKSIKNNKEKSLNDEHKKSIKKNHHMKKIIHHENPTKDSKLHEINVDFNDIDLRYNIDGSLPQNVFTPKSNKKYALSADFSRMFNNLFKFDYNINDDLLQSASKRNYDFNITKVDFNDKDGNSIPQNQQAKPNAPDNITANTTANKTANITANTTANTTATTANTTTNSIKMLDTNLVENIVPKGNSAASNNKFNNINYEGDSSNKNNESNNNSNNNSNNSNNNSNNSNNNSNISNSNKPGFFQGILNYFKDDNNNTNNTQTNTNITNNTNNSTNNNTDNYGETENEKQRRLVSNYLRNTGDNNYQRTGITSWFYSIVDSINSVFEQ